MGEARIRGTFEQRQAEGIAKREAEIAKAVIRLEKTKDELNANYDKLTPIQLQKLTEITEFLEKIKVPECNLQAA